MTVDQSQVLLVMEFAECGSLYKVLHQAKPAPEYNAGQLLPPLYSP